MTTAIEPGQAIAAYSTSGGEVYIAETAHGHRTYCTSCRAGDSSSSPGTASWYAAHRWAQNHTCPR
ncbi:hypothetical protein ACIPY6_28600 [Streptomyces sp. NPDC090054]|uniref:hypothetical protein n=1 Tax=Streptomyces sp. NPDC090054 TaxID=3365933 RepID=UPI00380C0AB9